MNITEKSWNDFWAYHWRVASRQRIPGIFEWDEKLVSLIEASCGLSPALRVLDLGCGGGDQAKVFAERGYPVVGIDIAEPLVRHARTQFDAKGLAGTFLAADMRTISYRGEFDLCTLLSGTFGFFSDDENLDLLRRIHSALRPAGQVFIMYLSAHRTDMTRTSWTEIDGGYQLTKTWLDTETSTYRSTVRLILDDGNVLVPEREEGYHANEVIRCYTPPEIERMLRDAGFERIVHLTRKHIDDPDAKPDPWDIREIAIGRKALQSEVQRELS